MAKSTKEELARRIFEVQEMILQRIPNAIIRRDIVEKYKITDRMAKKYVAKAYDIWYEDSCVDIDHERQMSIDRLKKEMRSLKPEYIGTPEGIKAMLMIEREINRLNGAYHPKRFLVGNDPENPLPGTEENEAHLEARISQLIKKAQE